MIDENAWLCSVARNRVPKAVPTGPVIRAKMTCHSLTLTGSERFPNRNVRLGAVYSNDPDSENRSFAAATPSGELMLNIDAGRPAAGAFEHGGEYYVDITPVGVPTYRYIWDGVPPLAKYIVLCTNSDGDGATPAIMQEEGNKVSWVDDTTDLMTSAATWRQKGDPDALRNTAFTHWRYPLDEELEAATCA